MRKSFWKIILIADVILIASGIAGYAFGMQRVHVTKITGFRAIELEAFTLDPGEQYSEELWVQLNEPPLPVWDESIQPAITFDYNVTGSVKVCIKDPEDTGISAYCFLLTDHFGEGLGTENVDVWLSGSYEITLSAYGDPGQLPPNPAQTAILSLRVTSEYYGMRENPLMMTIGGVLVFVGLATSGAGFGLMRRRRTE